MLNHILISIILLRGQSFDRIFKFGFGNFLCLFVCLLSDLRQIFKPHLTCKENILKHCVAHLLCLFVCFLFWWFVSMTCGLTSEMMKFFSDHYIPLAELHLCFIFNITSGHTGMVSEPQCFILMNSCGRQIEPQVSK